MPAPQPKTVSHEQLGHLSHRETAGRYLVPPLDPEGAPGHSAGAGVACVSPSYCLCQASCSCLHLEGSKVHLGGTIRDRLTVSGRDALWGFAAMCLPEKAWSCSELVCLYAGAQCPPNSKGQWLQPSLWSRGAAAGGYTAPCGTHGDPGAGLQVGMGALLGTVFLPCCCQEAHVHVVILLPHYQGIWGKTRSQSSPTQAASQPSSN